MINLGKSKVKIFNGAKYSYELEKEINKFLENKNIDVKSVSFSVNVIGMFDSYNAIILYEEKQ